MIASEISVERMKLVQVKRLLDENNIPAAVDILDSILYKNTGSSHVQPTLESYIDKKMSEEIPF